VPGSLEEIAFKEWLTHPDVAQYVFDSHYEHYFTDNFHEELNQLAMQANNPSTQFLIKNLSVALVNGFGPGYWKGVEGIGLTSLESELNHILHSNPNITPDEMVEQMIDRRLIDDTRQDEAKEFAQDAVELTARSSRMSGANRP
jgi:hypothetical protein